MFDQVRLSFTGPRILACLAVVLTLLSLAAGAYALTCGSSRFDPCPDGTVKVPPAWNSGARQWEWVCAGGGSEKSCSLAGYCGDGEINNSEACEGERFLASLDKNGDKRVDCKDFGFDTGSLFCTGCQVDTTSCYKASGVCGNSIVEKPDEQCDNTNLDSQTCQSLYKVDGTLACYPKGDTKQCSFNNKNCLLCGNGVKQGSEQCDGADLGGKKCADFPPYTGGFLGCNSCVYDFSGCIGGQGICGNGRRETGEDCDGFDLGDANCTSLGCGTGTLKCNWLTCKFDKSGCSDPTCATQQTPPTSGCDTPVYSDWTGFKIFTKPCCGEADKQVLDTKPLGNVLCTGGQAPSPVKDVYDATNKIITGWSWSCGNESCQAHVKAHCATSLSEETYQEADCSPGMIFENEAQFNAAVEARKKINPTQPLCAKGFYATRRLCYDPTTQSGWNEAYNKEWRCVGTAPVGQKNEANCLVGWAPPSKCGLEDGKTYPAGLDCSQSQFWQVENKPDTPDLCGDNNVLVANSKKYVPDGSFDETTGERKFTWQCKSIFGPRFGEAITCGVKLSGACTAQTPKCGNDAAPRGHFAYPDQPQPGQSLCLLGKPFGFYFYTPTYTWYWACRTGSGVDTKEVSCDNTAEAVCGPANGGDYGSEAAVRAAGTCTRGNLTANKIYDRGALWEWSCESLADTNVHALCSASTTRCGHAGDRAWLATTFDAKKGADGWLCASGTTAQNLSGPTYNSTTKKNVWSWACGGRQCGATKLECGNGDAGAYHLTADFPTKRLTYPSFLCAGGSLINLVETATGWTWGCKGADTDVVNDCYANKYRCGDAKGKFLSWSYFYGLFGVSSGQACAGRSTISSALCSGGVAVCANGPNPGWYCQTPASEGGKYISSCFAKVLTCGTANNKWYAQATLDNNSGKDNGLLCVKGVTNGAITYSKDSYNIINRADWNCAGYGGSSVSCGAGVINCGFGNGQTYPRQERFYLDCSKSDSSTCLCTNGNTKASPRFPTSKFMGEDFNFKYFYLWECLGDPSMHLGCQAEEDCSGC